ncbi:hypothetical protein [Geoglobus acetivorans]|uniref:Uncharacterized protein n=1 Tax=Geoglobus acetivorans TaxID=565033 RepID=A0A0A7GG06_GEOAI|nr:hypothetical protein GACE_1996 [Geoglobus acetivorans]
MPSYKIYLTPKLFTFQWKSWGGSVLAAMRDIGVPQEIKGVGIINNLKI